MSLAIVSLPACVRLSASALIVVPGTQRIPVNLLAGPTLGSLTPFSSQLIMDLVQRVTIALTMGTFTTATRSWISELFSFTSPASFAFRLFTPHYLSPQRADTVAICQLEFRCRRAN